MHPSNTQGEFRSKGFGMSMNNLGVKSPATYSREELGVYQLPSNRSSQLFKGNYGINGLKGNDQLN